MTVRTALVLGGAVVLATLLWLYFSPYQTCVRASTATGVEHGHDRKDSAQRARMNCARH